MKLALLALCGWLAAAAAEQSIRMVDGSFQITGWTAGAEPAAGWSSIFQVYVSGSDLPPMLGTYAVENGLLTFHPRFPVVEGVPYRAVFNGGAMVAVFDPPPRRVPTARVERVYPSANTLPSNQLKFYVFFTASMSRGDAWQHVHLLDANGKPVELAFLEIQQELWDRDYKRLTILFDPGRIKRGLVPTQEIGPPLVEGREYTLAIDQEWQDARGSPLAAPFRKKFRVSAADRTPPEPRNWHLSVPKIGSVDPLVLDFGKPMDFALLSRMVTVPGIEGQATIEQEEHIWKFVPSHVWEPGDFQVEVDTALEDLAGNRIARAFDVDTFDRVTEHLDRKTVSLPFRIRH